MLVDTHSHMYLSDFEADIESCMQRAREAGVGLTALPNIDSGSIEALRRLRAAYPEQTLGMMGLHPCSVKDNYIDELAVIREELFTGEYKAVGEIGIDLYWDKTHVAEQVEAFKMQISWAKELSLPIVIHARDSFALICEVLNEVYEPGLTGVFHCFTGSIADAERALAFEGFYLGIGGVVTFRNSGLAEVVKQTGLSRVVLETDAPYLTPAPFRGKRNETAYTRLVAEKLAETAGLSLDDVSRITTQNASKLFKLHAQPA